MRLQRATRAYVRANSPRDGIRTSDKLLAGAAVKVVVSGRWTMSAFIAILLKHYLGVLPRASHYTRFNLGPIIVKDFRDSIRERDFVNFICISIILINKLLINFLYFVRENLFLSEVISY